MCLYKYADGIELLKGLLPGGCVKRHKDCLVDRSWIVLQYFELAGSPSMTIVSTSFGKEPQCVSVLLDLSAICLRGQQQCVQNIWWLSYIPIAASALDSKNNTQWICWIHDLSGTRGSAPPKTWIFNLVKLTIRMLKEGRISNHQALRLFWEFFWKYWWIPGGR